jgi:hypothetical protein
MRMRWPVTTEKWPAQSPRLARVPASALPGPRDGIDPLGSQPVARIGQAGLHILRREMVVLLDDLLAAVPAGQ